ncbi:MAG TPA: LysM peptidoglycan-binding domain-containing protein [Candidatus Acidoferrales bacterium]|jgi:nucleoid-associated protein YgaU|nr:LysM peptidoglycan-binding domain-containing protein [Candidatus Acidoferrales bacterium]
MRILRHSCWGLQSGVLVSLVLGCAAASFAQDLGEIARQERARKQQDPSPAAHVYTNDDLQRQHILVPEDRARVLAARRAATNPETQVAQASASAAPVVAPSPAPVATAAAVSVSAPTAAAPAASDPLAAASPAPISTATIPAVSTAAAPVSSYAASAAIVTVQRGQTPLQAILQLVREASAEKHSGSRRFSEPAVAGLRSRPQPSPAGNQAAREEIAPRLVSRSAESRPHRHAAIFEPAAADPGIPDIITVQPGDSLWALARRYLGRGTRWRELAALNTQVRNANVLHVGEWICLPSGDLQNAREKIAPRTRAPAPRLVRNLCPPQRQGPSSRFLVTAEPLGALSRRELSPDRCTSTP